MANRNPKISIITISYNSERTIERAIKSVVEQDYGNLEYIIVDGKSTDGTVDIIKKYDYRIAKWISEPDKGVSDAFNKGIHLATGDVVGIINSDDGLESGTLKILAENYDPKVDVYRGNIIFWNEDTGVKIREIPSMHINYSGWNLRFCHQGTFISRSAYSKYGLYNTNYKFNMDYDLVLRFQNAGAEFKYIDYDMAYFTMGGITFKGNIKSQKEEMKTIIRSNGGTEFDVMKYMLVKNLKMAIKRVVDIDLVLRIKNLRANSVMERI